MRVLRLSFAVAVLMTSVGCVSLQPRLPKDTTPSASSAYVGVLGKKDTIANFGFGLVDDAKHEFIIPLENDLRLVQLPPGRYRVASWLTFAFTGEKITTKALPADVPLARPFEVGGGAVVIIGTFNVDRSMHTFWMDPVPMSAGEATTAVRTAYQGFAEAPVTCLTCAP